MQTTPFHLNLLCAWLGILLGFLSGLGFGLFFHRENWLGGYGSFQRRMYRLAHISFFGIAMINFIFYLTAQQLVTPATQLASETFILGAIGMPFCCVLMAHFPRTRLLFSIPVVSLLLGCVLMLVILMHPVTPPSWALPTRSETPSPQTQSSYLSFPAQLNEISESIIAKEEP